MAQNSKGIEVPHLDTQLLPEAAHVRLQGHFVHIKQKPMDRALYWVHSHYLLGRKGQKSTFSHFTDEKTEV